MDQQPVRGLVIDQRTGTSERDLQRFFGVIALSVHQMVLTLKRSSLITRKLGVARSIELCIDHNSLPSRP